METMRGCTAYRLHASRRSARAEPLSALMASTGALCVIKEISARWDPKRLFVYQDRLVVVKASFGEWFGRMLAMELGLIGMLIYRLVRNSRKATGDQQHLSAEELMAAEPKSVAIMVRDIIDARLSSGMFSDKLRLSLVDGRSEEFSWVKSQNDYQQVLGFLSAVLGTKLIDEKKAA